MVVGAAAAGEGLHVIPPMRIRESIVISADAATVWPFLADPVMQAEWNPKVVSIDRERSGPVRFGERFEMIYRMSGRENHSRVEVTVAQPSERVVRESSDSCSPKVFYSRCWAVLSDSGSHGWESKDCY